MTTAIVPIETAPALVLPASGIPPGDQHPAAVYIARLAPGSRRSMRGALDRAASLLTSGRHNAETLPWQSLRYQHTAALRAALAEQYAPRTTNQALAAVRSVLKEAWRLGLMSAEEYQRAADVHDVANDTLPRGRALTAGELRALFIDCAEDPGPAGRRDAALLALLYGGGLRRSEAVAMDLGDYVPETGAVTVRAGKGNKDRLVYATNGASLAMDAWLSVRGCEPGPLFLPITRSCRVMRRRLTPQAVLVILRHRAECAGVAAFSPHDLRRTMISDLLDAGADIATVQRLAGHANVTTTARYDRRGEKVKAKAAAMLHVPYVEA